MKVMLQVSTGLFDRCTAGSAAEVGSMLESMMKRFQVSGVIYGWGRRDGLFETILEVAHRNGTEAYLWLPVFADVRDWEAADPMVFVGRMKKKEVSRVPGEEFNFVCPGSSANRKAVMAAYDELSRDCVPDGVFLDRIRYPTAAISTDQAFGCWCPQCMERRRRSGADFFRLREKILAEKDLSWCAPDGLENGRYGYQDPDLEALAREKRTVITENVAALGHVFHSMGLKVGLDVFSPAMADWVGQDLAELLPLVDWIKPMMYYHTHAPAGIPFELQACEKAVSDALSMLWHTDIGSISSMERQLRSLSNARGKVRPGIEVNHVEGLCEPDAASYAREVNAAAAAGCDTLVLSWNVLQARETDLDTMARCLKSA